MDIQKWNYNFYFSSQILLQIANYNCKIYSKPAFHVKNQFRVSSKLSKKHDIDEIPFLVPRNSHKKCNIELFFLTLHEFVLFDPQGFDAGIDENQDLTHKATFIIAGNTNFTHYCCFCKDTELFLSLFPVMSQKSDFWFSMFHVLLRHLKCCNNNALWWTKLTCWFQTWEYATNCGNLM